MNNKTLIDSLNQSIRTAMLESTDVIVMGQDVARAGGVFRVTDGLLAEFGQRRVVDMPLSEALIAGSAVGMAVSGLRPIAEFQFMGFSYTALDQIINHASRISTRTRGKKQCPLVFRMPFGNHIRAPEHHAESMESLFSHIPGIRVVVPSCAQAGYDLTLQAIRCNDPVVVLEPLAQYHIQSPLQTDTFEYALNQVNFVSRGDDLTVISWGNMLRQSIPILTQLSHQGMKTDCIDLVSLAPIDYASLEESVKRTGRCVIIQESCLRCSVGQEICAHLSSKLLPYLRAPIKVISAPDAVVPYFRNTHNFLPQAGEIQAACTEICAA